MIGVIFVQHFTPSFLKPENISPGRGKFAGSGVYGKCPIALLQVDIDMHSIQRKCRSFVPVHAVLDLLLCVVSVGLLTVTERIARLEPGSSNKSSIWSDDSRYVFFGDDVEIGWTKACCNAGLAGGGLS